MSVHAPLEAELAAAGDAGITVSRYVELALYDPDSGFYATHGRAGRRGDFLTAPEVGPLFGAVVAAALDAWWHDAGRPERFPVIDWGAGPGTLARAVITAAPEVLTTGALRMWQVERSAPQRALHLTDHPAVGSVADGDGLRQALADDATPVPFTGVVLANELVDNLPFEIVTRGADGRWWPLRVAPGEGRLRTVVASDPCDAATGVALDRLAPGAAIGEPVPWQPAARRWLDTAVHALHRGRVVVFDYGAPTAALVDRGGWLRTHSGHDSSGDWLAEPGHCDITVDVATDQLQLDRRATLECTQAEWLAMHGIDGLVDEGRRIWEASAGVGDLPALRARSRVREAEALCDPDGMGGFRVLEWTVPDGK